MPQAVHVEKRLDWRKRPTRASLRHSPSSHSRACGPVQPALLPRQHMTQQKTFARPDLVDAISLREGARARPNRPWTGRRTRRLGLAGTRRRPTEPIVGTELMSRGATVGLGGSSLALPMALGLRPLGRDRYGELGPDGLPSGRSWPVCPGGSSAIDWYLTRKGFLVYDSSEPQACGGTR